MARRLRRLSSYVALLSTAGLLVVATGAVSARTARQAPKKTPQIAGTFTQALTDDPKTLDPDHMSLAAEDDIAAYIGASLVAVNPEGKIVPWLAKRWKFSNGGKTLTFTLRSNVKFQVSGDTLTAKDIQWTYERDLNPKTLAPVAASELSGITKILAPNPTTLVFDLSAPNGSILMNLSDSGYLAPVDPAQFKKYGDAAYGQHPSSVGPYELQSWSPGQSVTLVRDPAYTWAPPYDNAGAPYLKYLKFLVIPQQNSQVAAFASGQTDVLGVPPQDWNQYAKNQKYQFYQSVAGFVVSLDYNMKEPMFQNPKVRQAINLAIDRNAFVSAIFLGHGIAGWSPYAPNLTGYDKATVNYYPYNPSKAKQLLRQAGYKYNSAGQLLVDGKPLTLKFDTLPTWPYTDGTQLVQAELKAIGIQTTITSYELSTEIAKQMAATYDLAMFGYTWEGADPVTLLQILLTSAGGLDTSQYSSPKFTALMNQYVATINMKRRLSLVNTIQMDFVKAAPFAPIAYEIDGTAVSKGFKGIVLDQFTGTILLDNAYVG